MNIVAKIPIAEVREAKQQIEKTFRQRIHLKRGHSLFFLSHDDGILYKVDLTKAPASVTNNVLDTTKLEDIGKPISKVTIHRKIEGKNGYYFSALRFKSAMDHLKKFGIKTWHENT